MDDPLDTTAGRDPEDGGARPGADDPSAGVHVDPDAFRDALAEWASTVTVVAVRDDGDVHAVTATSFIPVSVEPPLVLVSLNPNARVLPFVEEGGEVAVTLLGSDQRRVAADFADAFPVGPSPFPADGPPIVEGGVVGLACRTRRTVDLEDGTRLVLAAVERVHTGPLHVGEKDPLLYHRRRYRTLAEE